MCSLISTDEVQRIKIKINERFYLVKKWHILKKAEMLLLKVTSMKNVSLPNQACDYPHAIWCSARLWSPEATLHLLIWSHVKKKGKKRDKIEETKVKLVHPSVIPPSSQESHQTI